MSLRSLPNAFPLRMHLALKAYQELLRTVQEMDRSPEPAVRDSSQVIKSESHGPIASIAAWGIPSHPSPPLPQGNIFYLMEYRELFLTLFRKFDETKQPRSFLRDLVETAHLFLRMLERFCRGRSSLVVQVGMGSTAPGGGLWGSQPLLTPSLAPYRASVCGGRSSPVRPQPQPRSRPAPRSCRSCGQGWPPSLRPVCR